MGTYINQSVANTNCQFCAAPVVMFLKDYSPGCNLKKENSQPMVLWIKLINTKCTKLIVILISGLSVRVASQTQEVVEKIYMLIST